jgi:hypothetical protein
MRLKFIFSLISVLFLISIMLFYFSPFSISNFTPKSENSNFSLNEGNNEMQFYPSMRFPSNEISYQISDCSLQKKNDMQYAFEIMENITNLKFNPVSSNGEISVTCEEKDKYNGELFIAGEGGPRKITAVRDFNVITKGEISLIRQSNCPKPNIALHELLHVLGFKHSDNPNNIMYNVSNCGQTISEDIIQSINKIYSVPSYPDLILENVSGVMKGRFLEVSFFVVNGGLVDAGESSVFIYAGDKLVKEEIIPAVPFNMGIFVPITNIWVSQLNVKELTFVASSDFEEISKDNNKAILEIK